VRYRIFYIIFHCCSIVHIILFSGGLCILRSKPNHVMVSVGSSANFTCRSTTPSGISWHFKAIGGSSLLLYDTMILPSGAVVSISYTADLKTSTCSLHGVGKKDRGTIACADDREKSFADLTVLGELINITQAVVRGTTNPTPCCHLANETDLLTPVL